MGLAAPKNRSKISNDPQNTTWANNTTRFGHRILTLQGWQPGDSLGASGAAHAAHYTSASQSHIRVFLKDDNLGLGAKRGSERAENFGLAGLESILERLNGKEEEFKKEEERREQIETRAFVYRKYGFMNFVSGGFLVGDTITKKADMKAETLDVKPEVGSAADKTAKKRKREERTGLDAVEECAEEEPKLKRKKKSMDLRKKARLDMDSKPMKSDKESKEKKSKKNKSKKLSLSSTGSATPEAYEPASDPEPLTDKARRKAERKVRKEEKKLKKALKKAAKKAAKSNPTAEESDSSSDGDEGTNTMSTSSAASPFETGTSTPVLASAGLTFDATKARGMHAVRQRWIRQKRAATMDTQAMNEIFMIKSRS